MTRSRDPRLYRDEDLGVLWLTSGRSELALSTEGVWLRTGRTRRELAWGEVDQLQLGDPRRARACVEIFAEDGHSYSIGPFPAALAEQWVRASTDVARRRGLAVRSLLEGVGFALP